MGKYSWFPDTDKEIRAYALLQRISKLIILIENDNPTPAAAEELKKRTDEYYELIDQINNKVPPLSPSFTLIKKP